MQWVAGVGAATERSVAYVGGLAEIFGGSLRLLFLSPLKRGRMLQRAIEYMPGLAALSVIRAWTGFRASTEDKLPIVGECPDQPSVYLATGHEGLGITTSLGTAQLLADLVMKRRPAIDAEAYSPSRFLRQPIHA